MKILNVYGRKWFFMWLELEKTKVIAIGMCMHSYFNIFLNKYDQLPEDEIWFM